MLIPNNENRGLVEFIESDTVFKLNLHVLLTPPHPSYLAFNKLEQIFLTYDLVVFWEDSS